jgi:hypothetical protein
LDILDAIKVSPEGNYEGLTVIVGSKIVAENINQK